MLVLDFPINPVELLVLQVQPLLLRQLVQHLLQVLIIRLFFEIEVPAVLQVEEQLSRAALAQVFEGDGHLGLLDAPVLLRLAERRKILPRKLPFEEIEHDEANSFQVIAPGELLTEVGVDAGVAGSASETFVVAVGYVSPRPRVVESLG